MANVTVKMRDGTRREFKDNGRPGGSYSQKVSYEVGFLVITDCYGKQTALPTADIQEVEVDGHGGRW